MIVSSVRRVAAKSARATPSTAMRFTSSASGTSLRLSARPRGVRKTYTLRRLPGSLPAHDVAEPLHRVQRRVRSWAPSRPPRGSARAGSARRLPRGCAGTSSARTERRAARGATVQGADQRARRILHEVRQPVVRHCLAPVTQDDLRVRLRHASIAPCGSLQTGRSSRSSLRHRTDTCCVQRHFTPVRADSRSAAQTSSVARAHRPSCRAGTPVAMARSSASITSTRGTVGGGNGSSRAPAAS